MPRKKVVPEEPEQVNDVEMEAQTMEEGVEQPPADIPQETETLPDTSQDVPPPDGVDTYPVEPPPPEEPVDAPEETSAMKPFWMEPGAPPPPPPEPEPQKNDRQSFYGLDFNALDRGLTAE